MKGASRLKYPVRIPNIKNDLRWILLLVIVFIIIILAWPNPASGATFHPAAAPTSVATTTPTSIPVEYLSTTDQTNGIICGSTVLVLIIVGGTVGVLRRKNNSFQKK